MEAPWERGGVVRTTSQYRRLGDARKHVRIIGPPKGAECRSYGHVKDAAGRATAQSPQRHK